MNAHVSPDPTLETPPGKIQEAVRKVGPLLEDVKKELGIAGV